MRQRAIRLLGLAGLLVLLTGADPPQMLSPPRPKLPEKLAPAPFPPPATTSNANKLRSDVAGLRQERDEVAKTITTSSSTERAVVRAQLLDLLKRMNERQSSSVPTYRFSPAPSRESFKLEGVRPVDIVRMAENLFKTGDTFAALQAFQSVDLESIPREDRLYVRYMMACCFRKMNKRVEAVALYREVAEARDVDELLSGFAISQLSMIRRTQDLEAQLEQLQSRQKSR